MLDNPQDQPHPNTNNSNIVTPNLTSPQIVDESQKNNSNENNNQSNMINSTSDLFKNLMQSSRLSNLISENNPENEASNENNKDSKEDNKEINNNKEQSSNVKDNNKNNNNEDNYILLEDSDEENEEKDNNDEQNDNINGNYEKNVNNFLNLKRKNPNSNDKSDKEGLNSQENQNSNIQSPNNNNEKSQINNNDKKIDEEGSNSKEIERKLYYIRNISSNRKYKLKVKDKLNLQVFIGNLKKNELLPNFVFASDKYYYVPHKCRQVTQNYKGYIISFPGLKKSLYNKIIKKDLEHMCTYYFKKPRRKQTSLDIQVKDEKTLNDGVFLNDGIVNFYLKIIEDEYTCGEGCSNNVLVMKSFFYNLIANQQNMNLSNEFSYPDSCSYTVTKINVFNYKTLIIPTCENYHWSLIIVNDIDKMKNIFSEKNLNAFHNEENYIPNQPEEIDNSTNDYPEIFYLDSFYDISQRRMLIILKYLFYEYQKIYSIDVNMNNFLVKNYFKIECYNPDVPKQNNTYDCGIYLLMYAEFFLYNPTYFLQLVSKKYKINKNNDDVKEKNMENDNKNIINNDIINNNKNNPNENNGEINNEANKIINDNIDKIPKDFNNKNINILINNFQPNDMNSNYNKEIRELNNDNNHNNENKNGKDINENKENVDMVNENNNNNKSEFDLDKIDIQIENYKDKENNQENNEDNNDILNALEQEGKFNDYAADNAYYDINNLLSNDLNKIDIEQDEKTIRNWFSDELINAQRTKIKNLIIELSKIDKKKELKEIMNEQNSLIKKYMEKQKEEFDAYFSKLKD